MAEDDGPSTFDADAIQAQVDLAMSMTEELVSTWVKPSPGYNAKSNLAQKKKAWDDTERELQAYMKRPLRLGVGARVSESNGTGTREAMALRNKLSSSSKQRSAKLESSQSAKVNGSADSDDDEDAKGALVRSSAQKRTRFDPFSAPKKKAKSAAQQPNGVEDGAPTYSSATKPSSDAASSSKLRSGNKAAARSNPTEATQQVESSLDDGKAPVGDSKKTFAADFNSSSSSKVNGFSTALSTTSPAGDGDSDEEEWGGFSDTDSNNIDMGVSPTSEGNDVRVNRVPLLNLNGPIADEQNEVPNDTKSGRKRKRRRKKLKSGRSMPAPLAQ